MKGGFAAERKKKKNDKTCLHQSVPPAGLPNVGQPPSSPAVLSLFFVDQKITVFFTAATISSGSSMT